MAIQNDKGESFGKIGKVIKRRYKKMIILQEAPGKGGVRQTEDTKRSASAFGQVSSWGAMIRESFTPLIMGYYDTVMTSRLTGYLNMYLKGCYNREDKTWNFEKNTLKALEGFEFNIDSTVRNSFFVTPEYSLDNNQLTIKYPEFVVGKNFKFPKDASSAEITIMVAEFNLEKSLRSTKVKTESIEFTSYENPNIAATEFTFEVTEGCLCIASVGVKYFKRSAKWALLKNTKDFSPAAIICALFNVGDFIVDKKDGWKDKVKKLANNSTTTSTEIR